MAPAGPTLAANPDYNRGVAMTHASDKQQQALDSWRDSMPTYAKELIAGGLAGGFAKTAVAPLERLKILYQLERGSAASKTRRGNFQSLGVWRSLASIWRNEGVLGFYRGNGATVMRIVPYAALHFMSYEQYRRWMIDYYPPAGSGPMVDLFAGSLAGGTAVVCTYPLDLARTRLACNMGTAAAGDGTRSFVYKGVMDVFRRVHGESGLRGLYRGVGATLWGIFPYAGLKFFVYESLKKQIPGDDEPSLFWKLGCGGVAGLVGQTCTYPLDVIRRQMQVQSAGQTGTGLVVTPFRGTAHALITMFRLQGWRQMYAGLSINYIKLVPSVAIGFAAYENLKRWLKVPPRKRPIAAG